jgi:hypothetical protein
MTALHLPAVHSSSFTESNSLLVPAVTSAEWHSSVSLLPSVDIWPLTDALLVLQIKSYQDDGIGWSVTPDLYF